MELSVEFLENSVSLKMIFGAHMNQGDRIERMGSRQWNFMAWGSEPGNKDRM